MSTKKTVPVKKPEKAKKPEGFTIADAQILAEARGITVSRTGLRAAAIRKGFIIPRRGEGQEKVLLDAKGFSEWLKIVSAPVPAGFVPIQEAAESVGLSANRVYTLAIVWGIPRKAVGMGGIIHIHFEKFKAVRAAAMARKKEKAGAKKPVNSVKAVRSAKPVKAVPAKKPAPPSPPAKPSKKAPPKKAGAVKPAKKAEGE
jgi:hypothetical protein